MKKLNIGIFLSLLLMVGLCSCGEQKSNTKLVLNEVLEILLLILSLKVMY